MSKLGLSPKEQAQKMGKSERTLSRWRDTGDGPPFVMIGHRVHYPEDLYSDWLERQYRAVRASA